MREDLEIWILGLFLFFVELHGRRGWRRVIKRAIRKCHFNVIWMGKLIIFIYDSNLSETGETEYRCDPSRPHCEETQQRSQDRFRTRNITLYPIVGIKERKLGACILNQPANQNVPPYPYRFSPQSSRTNWPVSCSATSTTTLLRMCGFKLRMMSSVTGQITKVWLKIWTISTSCLKLLSNSPSNRGSSPVLV